MLLRIFNAHYYWVSFLQQRDRKKVDSKKVDTEKERFCFSSPMLRILCVCNSVQHVATIFAYRVCIVHTNSEHSIHFIECTQFIFERKYQEKERKRLIKAKFIFEENTFPPILCIINLLISAQSQYFDFQLCKNPKLRRPFGKAMNGTE